MSITFTSTKKKLNQTKINKQGAYLRNVWGKLLNVKIESSDGMEKQVINKGYNSLYASILSSFNDHMPLVLSPDMIWLQILQQLAIHVGENPEKLRKKFVDFEGKKVLTVRRDGFVKGENNPWDNTFPEFAEQIRGYIGDQNYNSMILQFSTTTPVTQAAQEVALMDCMKSYFDYLARTMCGIPQITLEGERNDWQIVLDKANDLAKYDFGWWTGELTILLQEFVNVWDGKVDLDFWDSFVNDNGGSGGPYFAGHMLKLSAYYTDYKKNYHRMKDWYKGHGFGGLTTDAFTSGVSSVPFLWEYYDEIYPMTFASGFVGIEIVNESYRPNISWAVMDRQVSVAELEREANRFSGELREQGKNGIARSLESKVSSSLEI